MHRWVVVSVLVAGCGRLGFTDGADAGARTDADSDADLLDGSDATTACATHGLDSTWGVAGVALAAVPGAIINPSLAHSLAVTPGGGALVVGAVTDNTAVVRFDSQGMLDPGFGTGGLAYANWESGGRTGTGGGIGLKSNGDTVVITSEAVNTGVSTHLTPVGATDAAFGTSGFRSEPWMWTTGVVDDITFVIGPSPNVAEATCGYDFVVARFTASDSPDTAFSGNGVVAIDFGTTGCSYDVPTGFVVQPDGNLIVVGSCSETSPNTDNDRPGIVRLTPQGTPDPTFGTNGRICLGDIPSHHDAQVYADVQANGGIVLATTTATFELAVARLDSAGNYDAAFGTGGKTTTTLPAGAWYPRGIAALPDGKVVALVATTSSTILARYLADGTLDTAFGTGGLMELQAGIDSTVGASMRQLSGERVLVGGWASDLGVGPGLFAARVCVGN